MISGGRVVRDISGWMIVLYYDVGKEECERMLCYVALSSTLYRKKDHSTSLSVLSLPYQKAKKRKVHALRQCPSI